MNTLIRIKNLRKTIKSDLQKIDRLVAATARQDTVSADEIINLTKLLYDTRRELDGLIFKYEKRLCL